MIIIVATLIALNSLTFIMFLYFRTFSALLFVFEAQTQHLTPFEIMMNQGPGNGAPTHLKDIVHLAYPQYLSQFLIQSTTMRILFCIDAFLCLSSHTYMLTLLRLKWWGVRS